MEAEKLKLEKDGNAWGVLWGASPPEGIEGWGDTPEEAMIEFAKQVLQWAEFPDIKESEVKMEGIKPDKIIYDDLNSPIELSKKGKEAVKDKVPGGNMIQGIGSTRQIYIDSQELLPGESQKVYNHSPDGFAWGYGGSGPAQLALAIMLKFTDKDTALVWYQDFKNEHVAKWLNDNFSVMIDMEGWIKEKIKTR